MPMNPRLLRPLSSRLFLPTDADARAYVLAVNQADGQPLEKRVVEAIDAFVIGCKADSIWTPIKASCILMGARTLSGALTPLVGAAPTNNGPFVSGDYNRETGLLGNGATKYLDSNRNNNADPQNDKHIALYVTSLKTSGGDSYIGTSTAVSGNSQIVFFGSNFGTRLNSDSTSGGPGAQAVGFIGLSRSESASYAWRKGDSSGTISNASSAPGNANLWVFSRAGDSPSNAGISFYSIGESLNLALLRDRVNTLYNAIGAAIP